MQIDLMVTEVQCTPSVTAVPHGHAEDAAIEATSGIDVAHGKHEVI
jgi:hypothetical protein